MSNNLATIQKVQNVRKHPNADSLDLVQILGWQVVTKRGEYKDGDLCVYVAIDTILPERPEFEFLRNKNFRIKPIRLRGEESAGICFPLSVIPPLEPITEHAQWVEIAEVGMDVTDAIGIKHYEKPMPPELAGQAHGGLPGFLIMTDELNLRSYPDAVPEMFSRPYYITRKEDGCSGTYFINKGEFGVCSRKVHLKESETNGYWRMARKYNIEAALREAFPDMDVALQGEIIGPAVQENKLGLKELEFRAFNLFDINRRMYMDYNKLVEFTAKYNIPMVPPVISGLSFPFTLEELLKLANEQKYPTGGPAEGIVIRPQEAFYSNVLKRAWSGKVLNEKYDNK